MRQRDGGAGRRRRGRVLAGGRPRAGAWILAAILPAFVAGGPAGAEDPLTSAGKQALQRGDVVDAVEFLRGGADKGDPEAMYQLGLIHHRGREVAKDPSAALNWMLEAGNREHLLAQGWLCAFQAGERLYTRAAAWCRMAAERGDALAQATLGRMHVAGEGVPRDYELGYLYSVLAIAQLPPGPLRNRAVASRTTAEDSMSSSERRAARQMVKDWRPKPTP